MGKPGWAAVLLVLAALAVTLVEAGTAVGPGPASPGTRTGPIAVHTFSRWLDETQVRATSNAQWAAIARRDAVVVLNSWDHGLIPVLKRANPRVQVWVYKDLSGVRSDDCTTAGGDCGACAPGAADSAYLSSGMGYCWVRHAHPAWLLRAATGGLLKFRGYPHIVETDYGDPAYRRQWIHNVLADVHDHGWDGVEVDNALTKADTYGVAAKYRTDGAVQAATYAALQDVGRALHQAGAASVFNVGYATNYPGLWRRWLGPVGGLEQEFFLSFSTHPDALGAAWRAYEDEVSTCVSLRKTCLFHTGEYSPAVTPQTRDYALASYLLATNDQQLLSIGDMAPGRPAPAWPLGVPLSTMQLTGGAWRRYFAQGIALVNASNYTSLAPLGGTYVDGAGRRVSAVTLPPGSGAVLRTPPRRPGGGH